MTSVQDNRIAADENHLAGIADDGGRKWLDPIVSPGRFLNARIVVAVVLTALFLLFPWVKIAGRPAILLDLSTRQFTFFGVTFHPTDNLILLALGAAVIISVFFFTAIFGRVWCGYGCPQTIYMEFVFRPLETLFEGKPAQRRKRDAGPWTGDRIARKLGKWASYLFVGLILSRTFIAYFVGWDQLWPVAGTLADQQASTIATLVTTVLIFIDFAFLREQMCTTACPYGRLQSVLFDKDTLIVGYDSVRGEPRSKGKAREADAKVGDCIDCIRCVQTCPTGIDIRRGPQLECVGCAQCIDACDEIMVKIGKPKGLVRYASLREFSEGTRRFWRPRTFVYFGILCVIYSAFGILVASRTPAAVAVFKGANDPFRVLSDGRVSNKLRVRVTNQEHAPHTFTVSVVEPKDCELDVEKNPFTVEPDQVETTEIRLKSPSAAFHGGRATARIHVRSDSGFEVDREVPILGPEGQ